MPFSSTQSRLASEVCKWLGLLEIHLSLTIDCPEMHMPTSGLKAKLRLRPSPCVPLTCAHVHPFLSFSTRLKELHTTSRRGQTGVTASPHLSTSPSTHIDEDACQLAVSHWDHERSSPCRHPSKKKKKKNILKNPPSPSISACSAEMPLGNRGRAEETDSKQASVCANDKENVCETYSPPEPRVWELVFVSSRRWHVSARGRETWYVRFK